MIQDKNGVSCGYMYVGETCGFSGVIRNGDVYYVPLTSNKTKTSYYRFDNDKKKRVVYHDDEITLSDKEESSIYEQRHK